MKETTRKTAGTNRPHYAMLLAAGLGSRMRPLTLEIPKPLVKVAGKKLIDRSLEALEKVALERVVVNLHHLGDQVKAHLEAQQTHRPFRFVFSDESRRLLDSGGGIVNALPFLSDRPFFILNADTFWQEDGQSTLARLADNFDKDKMDMLLLTVRREQAAFPERGDFLINEAGRLVRAMPGEDKAVIYGGALIANPMIFAGQSSEPHSLNLYFDRAIAKGRLYGMELKGKWYTVNTVAAIGAVEEAILKA